MPAQQSYVQAFMSVGSVRIAAMVISRWARLG
jgi:hypothetical protein